MRDPSSRRAKTVASAYLPPVSATALTLGALRHDSTAGYAST